MKPKEILLKNINDHLIQYFVQIGFKHLKSKDSFKRVVGDFIQEITFCRNRYNSDNHCEFRTMWSVSSIKFSKWYKSQYGKSSPNSCLWSEAEWNLNSWNTIVTEKTILQNDQNDKQRMISFKKALFEVGIPSLEQFSNYDQCIDLHLNIGFIDKVKTINLLLMLDQKELALKKSKEFIKQIEIGTIIDQSNDLHELTNIISKF